MNACLWILILGAVLSFVGAAPIKFLQNDTQQIKSTLLERLKRPRSPLGFTPNDPKIRKLVQGYEVAIEDTLIILSHTYHGLMRLLEGTDLSDKVADVIGRATLEAEKVILAAKERMLREGEANIARLKAITSEAKAQIEAIAGKTVPQIELNVSSLDFDTVITVYECLQYFLEEAKYSERFLEDSLQKIN